MNLLVRIGVGVFALYLGCSLFSQFFGSDGPTPDFTPVSPENANSPAVLDAIMREYANDLDLRAVSDIARRAKDGSDFERLLNDPAEGVNNVDFDDDGKVDYIRIIEYGGGNRRALSLTTELDPGQVQEIATMECQKEPEGKAIIQTTGNPSLYGRAHHYQAKIAIPETPFLRWIFSNHPVYQSPFGGSYLPSDFASGTDRRPFDRYTKEMESRLGDPPFESSRYSAIQRPLVSPNAQKDAARAKIRANPVPPRRAFTPRSDEGVARSRTPPRGEN